jgi:hypothetical protein
MKKLLMINAAALFVAWSGASAIAGDLSHEVRGAKDIDVAFATIAKDRPGAPFSSLRIN